MLGGKLGLNGLIRQWVRGVGQGLREDVPLFYCSPISARSELEGGVDDSKWLDMANWFEEELWGAGLCAGSGRVRVSGADFLRGRSLGTERDSGASVHMGVVGALAGPVRAQGDRGIPLMEIDGGITPIFWLVASWMVRSNSLTSSIVMSGKEKVKNI